MDNSMASLRQLMQLAREARGAGQHVKAADLSGKCVVLAAHLRAENERVECLAWQGYSLHLAARTDDAIPVLMEAGNCRAPEVDPRDVFSAITVLIKIFLDRRPEPAARALIAEARGYLASIGKEAWRHKLDFLEGQLDLRHCEWEAADRHLAAAWQAWLLAPDYPSYTATTHLESLCDISFRRRDITSLRKWVAEIQRCEKVSEYCKIRTARGKLWLFRAERLTGGSFFPAVDLARTTLVMGDLMGGNDNYTLRNSLRVLALAGDWSALDAALAKHPLDQYFADLIFRGDERMCRARAALGLQPRDDEYETEYPMPDPGTIRGDIRAALRHLEEAAAFYRQAQDTVPANDQRRRAAWQSTTVADRIARREALAAATAGAELSGRGVQAGKLKSTQGEASEESYAPHEEA